MAETLNTENFQEKLDNTENLVVDFYAAWCGPCKVLGPIVDTVASEMNEEGVVEVTKINVDDSPEIAVKYGVRSIPTVIFFKDGKEVKRMTGLQSKETIANEINSMK